MLSKHFTLTNWILAAILLLGLGLRVAGLGWGIPLDPYTGYYHPDEPKIVRAIADFPAHIWSNHDLRYPTLYPYLLAVVTYPLGGLVQQLNRLAGSADPQLGYYLLARLGVILAGVLAVYGVYRLYRNYNAAAALLAAAFLAVAMIHVSNSAFATLDVPSSLVAVLAMMAAYRLVEQPAVGRYLWLGAALGALASVKYPAGMLATAALAAHLLAWWSRRGQSGWWWRLWLDYRLWLMAAAAVAVLAITTPGLVVHPDSFLEGVIFETARVGDDPDSRLSLVTWGKAMRKLFSVVGLPLGLAIWIGVGRALWRPTYRQILPLVFMFSYYFLFVQNMRRRYFIVLLPFMCLLAAIWLVELYRLRPQRFWRAGVGLLVAVVFGSGLLFSLQGIWTRLSPDPREVAARWLDDNAPAGSTVGFAYGNACDSGFDAPLYSSKFRVLEGRFGPDYLVLDDCNFKKLRGAAPDSQEFRFYNDVLNAEGQLYRYEPVAQFEPVEQVELDMAASEVYLYRSRWLAQQQFSLPPGLTPFNARWAGQIELAGYRCTDCRQLAPGQSLELALYWRALVAIPADYTIFVHLIDGQDNIIAQQDRQPLDGVRPTSRWVPGEVVGDTFVLPLPPGINPGRYRLRVGWYDALTGRRLETGQGDSVILPVP